MEALRESSHTVGFLGGSMNDIRQSTQADVGISVDTAVDAKQVHGGHHPTAKDLNVLGPAFWRRDNFTNMTKYVITRQLKLWQHYSPLSLPAPSATCLSADGGHPASAAEPALRHPTVHCAPWDHVDSLGSCTSQGLVGKNPGTVHGVFRAHRLTVRGICFLFLARTAPPAPAHAPAAAHRPGLLAPVHGGIQNQVVFRIAMDSELLILHMRTIHFCRAALARSYSSPCRYPAVHRAFLYPAVQRTGE